MEVVVLVPVYSVEPQPGPKANRRYDEEIHEASHRRDRGYAVDFTAQKTHERDVYELTVIMPVYNEAGCVRNVIGDWLDVLRSLEIRFCLMVIDDGSTDETATILDDMVATSPELHLLRQQNAGHGAAILNGYQQAESEWVFQTDSDGELPARDFEKLWVLREGADGVRGLRPSHAGAAYRTALRVLEPLPVALLFGRWHRDLNVPFRLYRKEALQVMIKKLSPRPFAPNALLTALAPGCSLDIRTVEISYEGRAAGASKLQWLSLSKACINVLVDLVRTRIRSL